MTMDHQQADEASEALPHFGDPPAPWGDLERAAAVIIPAPLEYTVCYGEGTAQGPAAIIAASTQMELYDEVFDWIPMSAGIATAPAVAMPALIGIDRKSTRLK